MLDVVRPCTPHRHSVIDVGDQETQQSTGKSTQKDGQPTYSHNALRRRRALRVNYARGAKIAAIQVRRDASATVASVARQRVRSGVRRVIAQPDCSSAIGLLCRMQLL